MAKIKTPNDVLLNAAENLIARLETIIGAAPGATSSPGKFISEWFGDEIIEDMHNAISSVKREGFAYEHMNHWNEFDGHPVADWQAEVQANETRLGYFAWAMQRDLPKYTVVGYYTETAQRFAHHVRAPDSQKAEEKVIEMVFDGEPFSVVAVFCGHIFPADTTAIDVSMMEGRRCPVTDCGGVIQYDDGSPGMAGTCLRCGQPS